MQCIWRMLATKRSCRCCSLIRLRRKRAVRGRHGRRRRGTAVHACVEARIRSAMAVGWGAGRRHLAACVPAAVELVDAVRAPDKVPAVATFCTWRRVFFGILESGVIGVGVVLATVEDSLKAAVCILLRVGMPTALPSRLVTLELARVKSACGRPVRRALGVIEPWIKRQLTRVAQLVPQELHSDRLMPSIVLVAVISRRHPVKAA